MLLSIDFMVYEISVRYGEACKMLSEKRFELVYVIGLLAIQFGNNWMKKNRLSEEFFELDCLQIGQACNPLTH